MGLDKERYLTLYYGYGKKKRLTNGGSLDYTCEDLFRLTGPCKKLPFWKGPQSAVILFVKICRR